MFGPTKDTDASDPRDSNPSLQARRMWLGDERDRLIQMVMRGRPEICDCERYGFRVYPSGKVLGEPPRRGPGLRSGVAPVPAIRPAGKSAKTQYEKNNQKNDQHVGLTSRAYSTVWGRIEPSVESCKAGAGFG